MNEEIKICGLAYNCQARIREADCSNKEPDHLPFKEKVNFINQLSDEVRKVIPEHQQVCSEIR